jgi:large subunit ribosomal protein L28
MAKVCDICGKQSGVGNKISHAHNLTKRHWLPNLRRVRAVVDGRVTNLNVCTKCIKAGKVMKAPHKERIRAKAAPMPVTHAEETVTAMPTAEVAAI